MNYLIKDARAIFSDQSPEATDIRLSNGRISELGTDLDHWPNRNETLVDAKGCVVWPGLVNTHHHLAQSVMKGVPAGINAALGDWLSAVPYQFWPRMTPELMYHAARLGLFELLRSGTTTCADHHYLYHRNSSPELEDAVWQAADELGIRLVLCRGGATVQGSHQGMLDHGIEPESIDQSLERMERTRKLHHQPGPDAMKKLVVAPTSLIHSSTPDDLKLLATWARERHLKLHSHLLEVPFDEVQAQDREGLTAVEYAESCGWLGDDVWFAHLVHTDVDAIAALARTGTGIAHCPTSNCRLGSGVAPVPAMAEAGVPISLAVDGSASAESGSMLQELNLAWLLHRSLHGPEATRLEQVLHWGSRGGAEMLGVTDTGALADGLCADLVLYDIDQPRFAGVHDPLLAPLMCGEPASVKHSFVAGRHVVSDGWVAGLDRSELTRNVQKTVATLLS